MNLAETYVNLRKQIDVLEKQLDTITNQLIPVLLAEESHSTTVDCWRITAVPATPPTPTTDWKTLAEVLRELVSQSDWDAAMELSMKPGRGRKAYLRLTGSLRK